MNGEQYQSYLLRIWQTDDEDEPVWRAQLECPGTGERQGFCSLEELHRYLDAQTGARGASEPCEDSELCEDGEPCEGGGS